MKAKSKPKLKIGDMVALTESLRTQKLATGELGDDAWTGYVIGHDDPNASSPWKNPWKVASNPWKVEWADGHVQYLAADHLERLTEREHERLRDEWADSLEESGPVTTQTQSAKGQVPSKPKFKIGDKVKFSKALLRMPENQNDAERYGDWVGEVIEYDPSSKFGHWEVSWQGDFRFRVMPPDEFVVYYSDDDLIRIPPKKSRKKQSAKSGKKKVKLTKKASPKALRKAATK